jgi:outer membrane protein assembly factor BamB
MDDRAKLTLLCLLAVAACKERAPPAGSGAIETTPSAGASPSSAPAVTSPERIVSFPGGALLVAEPGRCRLRAVSAGTQLWSRTFAACNGLLEPAIARDSTAYVRAGAELAAIELGGAERWRVRVEGDAIPRAIARPTTLADSRAVIAESPRSVAAYDAKGRPAWRFSLPSDETLVAPPEGLPTEGVALLGGASSYLLGADGKLRWRLPASGQ